jgi:hypothetical protein
MKKTICKFIFVGALFLFPDVLRAGEDCCSSGCWDQICIAWCQGYGNICSAGCAGTDYHCECCGGGEIHAGTCDCQ